MTKRIEQKMKWKEQTMKAENLSNCLNALEIITRCKDSLSAKEENSLTDLLLPKIEAAIEAL